MSKCMHLTDAFIQSDLQYIQVIHFYFCQYVCPLGIEPTTFALLTQCSTTEPQEHYVNYGFTNNKHILHKASIFFHAHVG